MVFYWYISGKEMFITESTESTKDTEIILVW